jgi:hypothetical protein
MADLNGSKAQGAGFAKFGMVPDSSLSLGVRRKRGESREFRLSNLLRTSAWRAFRLVFAFGNLWHDATSIFPETLQFLSFSTSSITK